MGLSAGQSSEAHVRLDDITTRWSLLRDACRATSVRSASARSALVLRYAPAIRGYIMAMVSSDQAADDLAQDVCVRLLNGDFGGADPDRGRFRDLLKTAVRNMVRNHWKREQKRTGKPLDDHAGHSEDDFDQQWIESWRGAVLEMAWSSLEAWQNRNPGSVACTLLRLRVADADASIETIGGRLSESTGQTLEPGAVRTQLHRARTRFTHLLFEEIARSLENPTPEGIDDELAALGLLTYLGSMVPDGG